MSTRAVIDLGTNTFHLLIVKKSVDGLGFQEVYRERRFIKLAENGIERIGEAPFQRGQMALCHFRKMMDAHAVVAYKAIGTAALRTADNGVSFLTQAKEEAQIDISLIPGSEEARLITLGVLLALPPIGEERVLIMDIGGGSVEFIIASNAGVHWAKSFPVGVAVLKKNFHQQEPISTLEIAQLEQFLYHELTPLWEVLADQPTHQLIGAAGTFDVIAKIMSTAQPTPHSHAIDLSRFSSFFQKCIGATAIERFAMPEIPADRADMIVVALILIDVILTKADIRQAMVSNYALKEGVLTEMA